MKGRKPKPTSRQIAEGDPRKKGVHKLLAKLESEPEAKRGLPACPRHLRGRARAAWKFWSEELAAMNLDSRPDAQMLEGACVAYETAVYAYEAIAKQGRFLAKRAVDPEAGKIVVLDVRPHPAVAMGNEAWRQLRAFCSEFGLSPVSRTRLSLQDHGKAEDLAEILSAPRLKRGVPAPADGANPAPSGPREPSSGERWIV